jgi:hypothetical protein
MEERQILENSLRKNIKILSDIATNHICSTETLAEVASAIADNATLLNRICIQGLAKVDLKPNSPYIRREAIPTPGKDHEDVPRFVLYSNLGIKDSYTLSDRVTKKVYDLGTRSDYKPLISQILKDELQASK